MLGEMRRNAATRRQFLISKPNKVFESDMYAILNDLLKSHTFVGDANRYEAPIRSGGRGNRESRERLTY
jgi:hypothetical protein